MVKTNEGATEDLIEFGEEFKYNITEVRFPGFKGNT